MAAAKLRAVPDHSNNYPYTQCRGPIRHRWDAVGPIPGRRRRATWGVEIVFRCEHCGTYRFDVLSRLTGELLSRSYSHPDDYRTDYDTPSNWKVRWMDEIDRNLILDVEDVPDVADGDKTPTYSIAQRNRAARTRNPR